ncbi:DNA-3-methyladenine glycosylase 2 family protein [uncultured Litoreibacter sp.]|uniref:DNA-3-methyladenine glycosylase family protein n=1 Tax=uncultured Litoreibacter sp. TaxID=1392394 RepID=UPI002631AB0C|nr:DNA-3-methyladenine glycosylase 2 family protein [uncultured Litoreibacter sp.]
MLRIIETDADVAEGAAWLAAHEPRFAAVLPELQPLPLRRRPDGFGQLLNAIMGQQVSTASAAAINARLEDAGLTEEANVAVASEDALRACGLSRQKIRYAGELARAGIDYDALRTADSATVIKTLTAVPGIGAWTAEIYAMFSLGHADVFAPGDLALQIAVQHLFELEDRPKEKDLRKRAQDWSPWRSVAARLLFTYYRTIKGREGIGT